jgi:hypothetical protein
MQTTLTIPSRESANKLKALQQGIHISARTGGVYETSKREVEPDAMNQQATSANPWARWGTDNNYPQRLIDTVMSDPTASLLERRAAFHYGAGLMFYKKIIEKNRIVIVPLLDEQVPAEITEFMYLNDFENFQQGIIADFEWWHAYAVQYVTNPTGKILQLKWQRMKDVRPELRDRKTGEIKNYYLSGYWPQPQPDSYTTIPAFTRLGQGSGLYVHKLVSIDKDYFPQPAWHGITRWLHIAAKIPRWILANIDNSINLKYHVKIPLAYFLARHPVEAYKTSEERNAAIQEDEESLYNKIDNYLAGEKNVHKAFYSKVAVDDQGKALPGWEIIAIDNKIQDEAWLRAYGTASMAIISGNGMNPSLAGSILPNGLGSGSGSDLREQFNLYMQIMTPQPRQTTLEPWEMIKRRNSWPKDLCLGYRDVILQSLDQAKSGYVKAGEDAPTSATPDALKV